MGTQRVSGIRINPDKMQVRYDLRGGSLNVSSHARRGLLVFGLRKLDLDITVPASCDIQVVNGSGSVSVEGVKGEIRLRTGSGRIAVSDMQGRMTLKTGSGSVSLADIEGQVTPVTGSGSIDAGQALLAGASQLKTGSGSITFEGKLDPRGHYQFLSGSGSVSLILPARAAFSLKASSGLGPILNEFGSNEVGFAPRAQLRVKTGNGGIFVKRSGTVRS